MASVKSPGTDVAVGVGVAPGATVIGRSAVTAAPLASVAVSRTV